MTYTIKANAIFRIANSNNWNTYTMVEQNPLNNGARAITCRRFFTQKEKFKTRISGFSQSFSLTKEQQQWKTDKCYPNFHKHEILIFASLPFHINFDCSRLVSTRKRNNALKRRLFSGSLGILPKIEENKSLGLMNGNQWRYGR